MLINSSLLEAYWYISGMDWRLLVTGDNERLYREAILVMMKRYGGRSLVDLGSADGEFTATVAEAGEMIRVTCVDHDERFLVEAAKKGFATVVGDLNAKLNLKANVADVVLANQVIEHVAKTDVFMEELYRILKPNGYGVICTPNLAAWHNIVALVRGYQPFSMQVSDEKFVGNPWHPLYMRQIKEEQAHLRVFTMKGLRDLCKLHGLKVKRAEGVGYYPLPAWLAPTAASWDPMHAAYLLVVVRK